MCEIVEVYDSITYCDGVVAVKTLFLINGDVVGEHLQEMFFLCLVVRSELELLCGIDVYLFFYLPDEELCRRITHRHLVVRAAYVYAYDIIM